jgi:formate dehydrogenase major subunit
MELERRSFLAGIAGSFGAGELIESLFGLNLQPARARARATSPLRGRITTTICPFCSVGCGLLVTVADGKVANLAGDPDHPINEGATCSKGAALSQIANSDRRVTKVLYRAPGSAAWEEKDWDWTLHRIARRVKETRDATFLARDDQGRTVNRTMGLASLGGAALDNEECYSLSKLARALGLVYLENHARL